MKLMRELYLAYVKKIGGSIICSDSPGRTIREARMQANITQEELSKLLGIRRETVSRIECGHIFPTLEFVKKFSQILAITNVLKEISGSFSSNFLSLYFNLPLKDIQLILEIALRNKSEVRLWK